MKPLYTEEEFNNKKNDDLLPLECLYCKKIYYHRKSRIKTRLSRIEKGIISKNIGSFCSPKCARYFENPPNYVTCKQCGKTFIKQPKEIKKTPNHFCSQSCAATYNNTHKTKGTRISKLELWIAEKLKEKYPKLEMHFNQKNAIDSELDIYIPKLKLAFELNGIFHYEPIYSHEKLERIQNNDKQKYKNCIEKEIELVIIDVSKQNRFTEKSSWQYLDIIKNIIDLNIGRA